MNGVIFIEIGKFAQSRLGAQVWGDAMRAAGIPSRIYYRVADYPDEEALALLSALSAALQEPVQAVLEGLGEFIETLRQEGSQTNPPRLRCLRSNPKEVVVSYDSPRRMCFLAKGIIAGIAKHYGETVSITEPSCMHKGDASCELIVRLA